MKILFVLIFCLPVVLSACGNQGPLYLPKEDRPLANRTTVKEKVDEQKQERDNSQQTK